MTITDRLRSLGPLRIALLSAVVVLVVLRPFAVSPPTAATLPALIHTVIVPALVPIVVAVQGFDLVMTAVFRVDADSHERQRLTRCLRIGGAGLVLVLLAWVPYFLGQAA
ncbi:hypothetical protein [Arhodomonas sp. AD133]|uniref:hypothetical protein n=1 Tax=Arhodomonas sp. AD133 TaxID=3415009 RepID=UPI003EBAA591